MEIASLERCTSVRSFDASVMDFVVMVDCTRSSYRSLADRGIACFRSERCGPRVAFVDEQWKWDVILISIRFSLHIFSRR